MNAGEVGHYFLGDDSLMKFKTCPVPEPQWWRGCEKKVIKTVMFCTKTSHGCNEQVQKSLQSQP